MTDFSVEPTSADSNFGRIGTLSVRNGTVTTPAMFPVINLVGGTTLDSGSSWRHFRDNILDADHLQGIMHQAMSFLDYGLTPDQLQKWRTKTFHEHFKERSPINAPLFIDSGGFRLMNSETFGDFASSSDEDWRLYTDADSILKLQSDWGADIIATLDYPIPPNLNEDEKNSRMKRSIESAIRCLKLVEDPDGIKVRTHTDQRSIDWLKEQKEEDDPAVFVALHGHDYETINWYVMNFLERVEEEQIGQNFQGFAIGSLVPLRYKTDILVDIIQGAKDAIPSELRDDIALHVFGVGGKQASILALLGVDTFDCSSHMQAARYRKYIVPGSWERVSTENLDSHFENGDFPCAIETCPLCNELGDAVDEHGEPLSPAKLQEYLMREPTYGIDGFTKSAYYGWLARHNFEVYNDELRRVRQAIKDGTLLDYAIKFARRDRDIQRMLKRAQVRDSELLTALEERGAYDLLPGPKLASDQSKLSDFGGGISEQNTTHTISLEHSPNEFNILTRDYEPPSRETLLVIPCSKIKPYSKSKSHKAVFDSLIPVRNKIHKVTVSGMFGPVPEEHEDEQSVLNYEYVLAPEDTQQKELATDRLTRYLEQYGGSYDQVVAYATSKNYRQVIEDAFERYGRGTVFPQDPNSLRLREHFRKTNIQELTEHLGMDQTLTLADLE
jgi:queuine/archaeosine tRNA-ribosyltransferase